MSDPISGNPKKTVRSYFENNIDIIELIQSDNLITLPLC